MNDSVLVRPVSLAVPPRLELLSDEERGRAARITSVAARGRFVGTRAALRSWLAEITGARAQSLFIAIDAFGRPHLPECPELRFSLSHSHELGAIAISAAGRDVGIDVERVRERPRLGPIARRTFAGHVADRIERAADPTRAFYDAWTRHEALVKAPGARVENLELAPGYSAALARG